MSKIVRHPRDRVGDRLAALQGAVVRGAVLGTSAPDVGGNGSASGTLPPNAPLAVPRPSKPEVTLRPTPRTVEATVTWSVDDPGRVVVGYRVQAGGVDRLVTENQIKLTLEPDHQYTVRVIAYDAYGNRNVGPAYTFTAIHDLEPPEVPTDLTASPLFHSVSLEWDTGGSIDVSYSVIEWTTQGDFSAGAEGVVVGGNGSAMVPDLEPGVDYRFRVRAVDEFGNSSDWSEEVTSTTLSVTEPDLAPLAVTEEKLANLAVTLAKIADGAVSTAKIAADAVTAGQLADDAVGSEHLQALAVAAAQIQDSAITTAKLAADAVTEGKLADDAVGTEHLQALAVTAAEVQDSAITTAKIAADAVTAGEIASGAVTSAELADLAVTLGKIADGAVTTAQIAADAITDAQLATDAVTSDALAPGSVSTDALVDAVVTAAKIGADAVTAAKIEDAAVTAAKLADGAVTSTKLNVSIGGGNLFSRSSAEGGDTGGFSTQGSTTLSAIPDPTGSAPHGDYVFESLVGSSGNPYPVINHNADSSIVLREGTTATLSAWVYWPATSDPPNNVVLRIRDAQAGQTWQTDVFDPPPADTWTRYSTTFTVPAGLEASYYYMGLAVSNATAEGDVYYHDALQLEIGDVATAYAPKPDEILPGTITTTEIADDSITTPKLVAGSVAAGKIAADAVTANELAANAVYAGAIQADAVGATAIAADVITAAHLAAGTITSAEIAADTILAGNIAAGQISTAELAADSVTTAKIDALAVTASELAAGSVVAGKIAADAVTAGEIAADTITSAEIAAATITGAEIAADTITAAHIDALTITASEIAADAITTSKILAGAVTANEIAADTITASEISAGAITASEIAADAVTTAKIDALAVTASEIAADAITSAKIFAGAITTVKLDADAVTSAKIAANTITAAEIAAGTITAAEIAADTITANEIAALTIGADEIAANAIVAGKIAALAVTAGTIDVDAVTANEIEAGSILTNHLTAGAVTTEKIEAGAITANEIAAGAISADDIVAGTLTGSTVRANVQAVGQWFAHEFQAAGIYEVEWGSTEGGLAPVGKVYAVYDSTGSGYGPGMRLQSRSGVQRDSNSFATGDGGELLLATDRSQFYHKDGTAGSYVALTNGALSLYADNDVTLLQGSPAFNTITFDKDGHVQWNGMDHIGIRNLDLSGDIDGQGGATFGDSVLVTYDNQPAEIVVASTYNNQTWGSRIRHAPANWNRGSGTYVSPQGQAGAWWSGTAYSAQEWTIGFVPSGSGVERLENTRLRLSSSAAFIPMAYDNTTGFTPNINVISNGLLRRNTSSERYKADITEATFDSDAIASLQWVGWMDKAEVEEDLRRRNSKGKMRDEDWINRPADDARPDAVPTPYYGVTAENVAEVGLDWAISVDEEGRPDGVSYDRLALAAGIAALRRIADLEKQLVRGPA